MITIGEVAKGFLIFCCGFFLYAAMVHAMAGHAVLAAFMLFGFSAPLSYVLYAIKR